uniref:Uncharacterized protein n=1 Tax=Anopheles darlingi TaxID=43151 RepID=A0A2M4DBF5_ANODA
MQAACINTYMMTALVRSFLFLLLLLPLSPTVTLIISPTISIPSFVRIQPLFLIVYSIGDVVAYLWPYSSASLNRAKKSTIRIHVRI